MNKKVKQLEVELEDLLGQDFSDINIKSEISLDNDEYLFEGSVSSQGNSMNFKIKTRNQTFIKDDLFLQCTQCGNFITWYEMDFEDLICEDCKALNDDEDNDDEDDDC